MWIERIASWTSDAKFAPPAGVEQLTACEPALGHALPETLRELLLETDGVEGAYGLGLIWPSRRIGVDNVALRTSPDLASLYIPFDPLLFFADAGNGDQFAFVLRADRQDIFVWDHESDGRTWAAPDLATYLQWCLDGRLRI